MAAPRSAFIHKSKVTNYQNEIRLGIIDILNKISIEQIENEKTISKDQSVVLVEKMDRFLSAYTELQAIAGNFLDMSGTGSKTQAVLENIYFSFIRLEDSIESKARLTEGQVDYIGDVYQFLTDVYNRDVTNMTLDDALDEMEQAAERYPGLNQQMEGLD